MTARPLDKFLAGRAESVLDDDMNPHVIECFKHHDVCNGAKNILMTYIAKTKGSKLGMNHCHCAPA